MSIMDSTLKTAIFSPTSRTRLINVTLITALLIVTSSKVEAEPNDDKSKPAYVDFNPNFLHGLGIDIERFTEQNPILPGSYLVKIVVNDTTQGKFKVNFVLKDKQASAYPCFTFAELLKIGINAKDKKPDKISAEECHPLGYWLEKSSVNYIPGDFELVLQVPQINFMKKLSGATDPSLWEEGSTVGFVDYSASAYANRQRYVSGNTSTTNNNLQGIIEFNTGINLGAWRFRKRSNIGWQRGSHSALQNLYTYVARDITALKSQLMIGDTNTDGEVFDSFGLRGATLFSDGRMRPDFQRSYTPVVRGIANTNARVRVTQRGQTIYEAVVPPGAFEFTDIGTMGYGGDLEMTIIEADGRQRSQIIPFSAPPELLTMGVSRFAFAVGQLKDAFIRRRPTVLQGNYHYGILSGLTLFGGLQMSKKYIALALGNAFNTPLGGLSLSMTHARNNYDTSGSKGNSFKATFSKYFTPTDTNISLAAYRYSSKHFFSLRDANINRENAEIGSDQYSYRTRHQFSATLSQRVTDTISLNLTGSYYSYWADRNSSRQYSLTLNHALRYFSYAVTASRLKNENNKTENSYVLSVSVPLGRNSPGGERPAFGYLYNSLGYNDRRSVEFQTSAAGSQGEQNEWTYGIGAAFGKQMRNNNAQTINGNVGYKTSYGQLAGTASANNRGSGQLSLSANGSIVAHRGGITTGPAIGSAPFAIVGAKGARGARLLNGNGASIGYSGYAIVPSLTPYRENSIALNSKYLTDDVDVLENESVVVPKMGAAIAVNMRTVVGKPMVLTLKDEKNEFLPIGTNIINSEGTSQGIVGQGGMVYVRGWVPEKSPLYVITNNNIKMRCRKINTSVNEMSNQITYLEVLCSRD